MGRMNVRRWVTAGASALLLAFGAGQPSVALSPCQDESLCDWEIDCFYMGEDGEVVWFCRIVKRCYC